MNTWADFGLTIPTGASGEVDLTCPQCSAQRKKKSARCLSVNIDKGIWICHHCGFAGSLTRGKEVVEVGWRKPQHRRPSPLPIRPLDPIEQWFANRKIPRLVIERNKITPAKVYMPQVEDHVGAIAFPYFRDGELINVKYRDRQKNFRMETGAERILYGCDDIDNAQCVLVEGEVDKLSIETAGIISCVSVPDGAPPPNAKNYAGKFSFLDNARIETVKEWIIAVDNDPPGTRLEQELARRIGIEKCKRVRWPEGCKDANDVLVKHGAEALRKCIESAEPFPLSGVIRVMDLHQEITALYENGVQRGLSTGWKTLDEYYTVRAGEVTVVTGVPNSGKSNWVDGLIVNLMREHDWRFVMFTPENQPVANHISRIMEHYTRVPFRSGPTERMRPQDVEFCEAFLDEHVQFLLPADEDDWTLSFILERAEQLVRRCGIEGVVIDPWNEIQHERGFDTSETEYIGVALRRIRQFARRCHVHVWIVAHPTKLYRNKNGEYPVPTLYDISGSAHFRNKADNGIVIWRDLNDPGKHEVEIHIQKIRFREIGKLGGCSLKYNPVTGGYEEWLKPKEIHDRVPEHDADDVARSIPNEWWQS